MPRGTLTERDENVFHWIKSKGAEIRALTSPYKLLLSYGAVKSGQFGPWLPLGHTAQIQAKMDEIKTLCNTTWGAIIHVRIDYDMVINLPKAVPPPPPSDPYEIPDACPIANIEQEFYA